MRKSKVWIASALFFSLPASDSYSLKAYDMNGGGDVTSSSQYVLYGTLGGLDMSEQILGTTRNLQPGIGGTIGTSTPPAPALSNDDGWYNRLQVVINTTGNTPADTEFAISISPDNWSTVYYVKADSTISASLTLTDYRNYAGWGGASGETIVGLRHGTTYRVRATALQGQFTESGFGPSSDPVSTTSPELSFDIDVDNDDAESSPPYALSLGIIGQNVVTTATQKIWYDLTTNGDNGATIYGKGLHGGLNSLSTGHSIMSANADLANAGVTEGFGLQVGGATQSGGGPLIAQPPFNGSDDVVGGLSTAYQPLFITGSAIISGRTSILVKAKVSDLTPAARDYQEILLTTVVPTF